MTNDATDGRILPSESEAVGNRCPSVSLTVDLVLPRAKHLEPELRA